MREKAATRSGDGGSYDRVYATEYEYDAWGNTVSVTNGDLVEITNQNDIGNLNPIRYRGYYWDSETNLYYLQSRYYDPTTMRFINADEIVYTERTLQGNNLYAYCYNNPVNMIDATGDFPLWDSIVDFVSTAVQFVGSVLTSFEYEAGIGYGLKAGVSSPVGSAEIGGKADVLHVKGNDEKIEVGNETQITAQVSVGRHELGLNEKIFHKFDCDCSSDECPYKNIEQGLLRKNESIPIIGIDFYLIVGGNASISFNVDEFEDKVVKIFEE